MAGVAGTAANRHLPKSAATSPRLMKFSFWLVAVLLVSSKEFVRGYGEVSDAHSGGVVDGVGYGGGRAADADLAYPFGAHGVDVGVALVDPGHVHLAHVGVGGVVVLGEVLVDDVPEAGVHQALLVQRHGEAHRHSADE